MMPRHLLAPGRGQRGAATLIVVMVLFLVMALLAAYANRSLVFEQRIAGGYYRASLAQEVAEGGIDWTVSMLNGTAIDGSCLPVANGGTRFIDKYMSVSPADRANKRLITIPDGIAADCVRTGNSLDCRCPDPDTRTAQPTTVVNGSLAPSFGVQVGTDVDVRYGNFLVLSQGCTDSSIDSCRGLAVDRSKTATAASEQSAGVAFIAAVPSSPSSPVTVKGTLSASGTGGLGLHNTDPATSGSLVLSGGAAPSPALVDSRMDTLPGTPPGQAQAFDNAQLAAMSDDLFFQSYMGMAPGRYVNHPALRKITCQAGGDCGPTLLAAYTAGKRMLFVDGALNISSNVVIGTAAAPVLIIANGTVTLTGPMQLSGMLVGRSLIWTNTGGLTSQINGMVLVSGNMTTTGNMDVIYRQDIANEFRNRLGSYARVSGGLKHNNQ